MLALKEGLGLGQIGLGVLHEVRLGLRAAEAVGLAFDGRVNGAIRLHILAVGKAPAAHIVELTGSSESGRGEANRKCAGESRRYIRPLHGCVSSLWGFRPLSACGKNAWPEGLVPRTG